MSHIDTFNRIASHVGHHNDKLNLSFTNTAMYNIINHNVICWHDGKFCFNELYMEDKSDKKFNYRPVSYAFGTEKLRELAQWKVLIRGPRLAHGDNQSEANDAAKECKKETVKALFLLSELDVPKIDEIEFLNTDMLSPNIIDDSLLRPFALKRIQVNQWR